MARTDRASRPRPPAQPVATRTMRALAPVYLVALLVAVVVCFWPLAKYFFAQDDFRLIAKAAYHPLAAVTDFYDRTPGHFRPLSKGAYFVVMYRVFGMHAAPYHIVSLLLHLFNVVMVWRFLRRLGANEYGSLCATALFGLSVAWFHVVGWISCVQQLMALSLALVSIEFGLRALAKESHRDRWISVAAYAGALGSAEQAVLVPVVVLLYAVLLQTDGGTMRERLRNAFAATTEHWALLVVFALFVAVWKRVPDAGPYRFEFGTNVFVNLSTYVGWSFHYLMQLPREMTVAQFTFDKAHVFFVALVGYLLVRGRQREVAFGLGYFLLTILPTLFLVRHQFYLHTYVAAPGMLYLVALAAGDLFTLRWVKESDLRYSMLGIALIVLVALSFQAVRRNENMPLTENSRYRRSFVIRRAIMADNAWRSIARIRQRRPHAEGVAMMYGRPGQLEDAAWNNLNVIEAMGKGALQKLAYGTPDLSVQFLYGETGGGSTMGMIPESSLPDVDRDRIQILIYDDLGNCFTPEEAY